MPSKYIVSAVKFIAINALSFHINDMYIHPIVGRTAINKLAGYMLAAVNIILNMISNELIHLIVFSMISPCFVFTLPYPLVKIIIACRLSYDNIAWLRGA
jgi:hypothetical protein